MRESWSTGRFWFNYAARTCLDKNDIYRHAIRVLDAKDDLGLLEEVPEAELEPLIQMKMEQRTVYEEEWASRLAEEESE